MGGDKKNYFHFSCVYITGGIISITLFFNEAVCIQLIIVKNIFRLGFWYGADWKF